MRISVVLVRTDRGACHLAQPRPVRGRYRLACWRTIRPTVVHARPADLLRAWDLEWVCADCHDLARLPPERFLRATGWDADVPRSRATRQSRNV